MDVERMSRFYLRYLLILTLLDLSNLKSVNDKGRPIQTKRKRKSISKGTKCIPLLTSFWGKL